MWCVLTLNIVDIVRKSGCTITIPHENSRFGSKFLAVSSSNRVIDLFFKFIYQSKKQISSSKQKDLKDDISEVCLHLQ